MSVAVKVGIPVLAILAEAEKFQQEGVPLVGSGQGNLHHLLLQLNHS